MADFDGMNDDYMNEIEIGGLKSYLSNERIVKVWEEDEFFTYFVNYIFVI